MAFFNKTSPGDMIEADLKASLKTRKDIEQKLSSAMAQTVECQATVDQLGRDVADDFAVNAALTAKRAAEDLVTTRTKSLDDLDEKIADLQDAIKELADQKTRRETAAAIEMISKKFTEAGARFDAATAEFIEETRRTADFVLDAHGLTAYLMNAKAEVPAATALIAQILKDRAAQTIAKTARAELIMPEQIAPRQTSAPPARTTMRLFLTQHLGWHDAQGDKHRAPSMHDAELPLDLVGKARALGAAHDLKSDMRAKHFGSKTSAPPAWEHCKFLNDDPRIKSNVAPIMSSHLGNFQVVDRGPPVTGTMRSQPAMAATRSEPIKK
jgi:hypothetical protein